jgi:predicted metallopeptidase
MTDTNTTALNVTTDNDSQQLMDALQAMDKVDCDIVKTVDDIMSKAKAKAKPKAKTKASQSVLTIQQQPIVVVTLYQGQELHIHFDGNPNDSKILFI